MPMMPFFWATVYANFSDEILSRVTENFFFQLFQDHKICIAYSSEQKLHYVTADCCFNYPLEDFSKGKTYLIFFSCTPIEDTWIEHAGRKHESSSLDRSLISRIKSVQLKLISSKKSLRARLRTRSPGSPYWLCALFLTGWLMLSGLLVELWFAGKRRHRARSCRFLFQRRFPAPPFSGNTPGPAPSGPRMPSVS